MGLSLPESTKIKIIANGETQDRIIDQNKLREANSRQLLTFLRNKLTQLSRKA